MGAGGTGGRWCSSSGRGRISLQRHTCHGINHIEPPCGHSNRNRRTFHGTFGWEERQLSSAHGRSAGAPSATAVTGGDYTLADAEAKTLDIAEAHAGRW